MRENRTSGLMRGSNGNGDSRPLLSTLLVNNISVNPVILSKSLFKHSPAEAGWFPEVLNNNR